MAEPYLPFPLRCFDRDPAGVSFLLLNVLAAKAARAEFGGHAEVPSTNSSSDHTRSVTLAAIDGVMRNVVV